MTVSTMTRSRSEPEQLSTYRVCRGCGVEKFVSEFYLTVPKGLRPTGKCKACISAQVRKHRAESDRPREYDAERYRSDPERRAKIFRDAKKRIADNPERRKAHTAVGNAVRDGRLEKPDECSRCGDAADRLEGHHHDYSKPLDVEWLCCRCHRRDHFAKPF